MNRINQLFAEQRQSGRKLLSLYFCAGCPTVDGTAEVILTLQRHGIDMIEVGMPFSDPLADGPVIQNAGTIALKNGMTTDKLFQQLESIKEQVTIPLVWMGYLNVVMHYGYERFFKRCVEVGISGVIIPDLPFQDYLDVVKPLADRYDLRVVMMITPETSEERIRFIDEHTDGFIYMVSSASITGAQSQFGDAKIEYFRHIDGMNLRNPRMIGFGISNRQTLLSAQQHAAGAIIGSKFVTLLLETGNAEKAVSQLYKALEK
ncbi:MAG: tryptophan synthase subunit alpha [Prevotella sp.]|nr:tryptophan synthase subunit alpha [Prevotella sp.]